VIPPGRLRWRVAAPVLLATLVALAVGVWLVMRHRGGPGSDPAGAGPERVATSDPRSALARAVAAIREKRFAEAHAALEVALESRAQDADVHYWLGVTHRELGRPQAAIEHLERALALRPDHRDAHLGLATLLEAQDRRAEARSHYERLVELDPADAEVRVRLGVVLLRLSDLSGAIAELEEVVRLSPGDADAHWLLGRSYQLQGDPERAAAEFARAVEIEPGHRAAAALDELRSR
jgi:tetratricopeptide (TPR) repeat protein